MCFVYDEIHGGLPVCLRVSMDYRSCESSLQQLPGHWMNELLSMLQSATASKSLSFTRRSAGLPFFIQVSQAV